jgi:hypothetical protein
MIFLMAWGSLVHADPSKEKPLQSIEQSDLNRDEEINTGDLAIFGSRYLHNLWTLVDWCGFYDATTSGFYFDGKAKKAKDKTKRGKPTKYYKKHFKLMLSFINDEYGCESVPPDGPGLLDLENEPRYLVRMAKSSDGSGDIYITDPGNRGRFKWLHPGR